MLKMIPFTSKLSNSTSYQVTKTQEQAARAIASSGFPTTCPNASQPLNSNYLASATKLIVHPSTTSCVKRTTDIWGAIVGLRFTAAVAILIVVAVQLNNPGFIFYSQTRCGLNGRPFRIWKFRSMVVGAEQLQHLVKNKAQGQIFNNSNDLRITCVGCFLRRTNLDELPQFWNVLLGT